MGRANEMILDLDIPIDEVYYMLKHYKNRFQVRNGGIYENICSDAD